MKTLFAVIAVILSSQLAATVQALGAEQAHDDNLATEIAAWLATADALQGKTLIITDFVNIDYSSTPEGRRIAMDLALAASESENIRVVPPISVNAYLLREGMTPNDLSINANSMVAAEALGFEFIVQGIMDVRGDRTQIDVVLLDANEGTIADQKSWTHDLPKDAGGDSNRVAGEVPGPAPSSRVIVVPGGAGFGTIDDCTEMLRVAGIDYTRREYRRDFSQELREQLRQYRDQSEGRHSGGNFDGNVVVKKIPIGLSGALDSARFSRVLQELETDEQRELTLNEMELLLQRHTNDKAIRNWRYCVNKVSSRGISGDITIYEDASADGDRVTFTVLYLPLDRRDQGALGLLSIEGGTVTSQTHHEGDVLLRGTTVIVNVRPDDSQSEVVATLEIGNSVAHRAVENERWRTRQKRAEAERAEREKEAAAQREKQLRRQQLRELVMMYPIHVTRDMVQSESGFDDGTQKYGKLAFNTSYHDTRKIRGIGMHPDVRNASIAIDVPEGATKFTARLGYLGDIDDRCDGQFGDATCGVMVLGDDGATLDSRTFALDGGDRDHHYSNGVNTHPFSIDVAGATRLVLSVRGESNAPYYIWCTKVFWYGAKFESDYELLLQAEGLN